MFTLFHHRTDYITLPSLRYLASDKLVCRLSITGINDTVFNREPVRRKFIDHRHIQIPVQDDCQCTRNRCRAHNKNMRQFPFSRKLFSLFYSKSMLFVSHNKCQIRISYFLLDQRVRSDNDLCLPRFDTPVCKPFFFCCHRTCQQFYF